MVSIKLRCKSSYDETVLCDNDNGNIMQSAKNSKDIKSILKIADI